MPEARSEARKAAALPTSVWVTLRCRGAGRGVAQHGAKAADARRGQRLDRTGRDRVGANAARSEVIGDETHARLEAGLGRTHDVVARHGAVGAEIGEGDQRSVVREHAATGLGQRREAVGTDVVRHVGGLARQAVEVTAGQRFARRIADGMNQDIELIPVSAELLEQPVDLLVLGDVQRQHDIGAERGAHLLHACLELVALIGQREFRALAAHRLGDAVCDRALTGQAGDQRLLAV